MSDPPRDPPAVHCRHLLACRTIWYDPARPDEEYSLFRLVVSLRPSAGSGGRFVEPRLFVFAQVFGDAGDYDVWVRLVKVFEDGNQELAVWGRGRRRSRAWTWSPP